MFKKKSIDEWAWDYWLLSWYIKLCYRIYYRKFKLHDTRFLLRNQPVILAPNHQNALMDALTLVCGTWTQTVFLARADIFKGKFVKRLLHYFNIMPIYRIRDGYENLKRNDEVFEKTTRVILNRHNPLLLFPEGNHGDKRRLRNLVKGLFRVAFQAQQEFGDKPGVKIVPMGINYSHYENFRTTLLVNFGPPIEVSEFYNKYTENPAIGINALKDHYAAQVSKLMIDIQSEEFYDTYMALRTIFNSDMRKVAGIREKSLVAKFTADKKMIAILDRELQANPSSIASLHNLVSEYQALLQKKNLRDWVVRREKYSFANTAVSVIAKILLLPLAAAGFLNNILPYWFAWRKGSKVKDPQFRSSFKFVIGVIVFPLWYIILACLFMVVPVAGWIKALYVLSSPVTGLIAFHYYIGMIKLRSKIKYSLGVAQKEAGVMRLKSLRKDIVERMYDIVNRQMKAV